LAVVASVIARYDAISMAVRDTARAFGEAGDFEVDVFAPRSDFPELHAHQVGDGTTLCDDRAFRSAVVAIYHFGVFSPVFDAIAPSAGRQCQIVYFHGITPPDCVAPSHRPLLERSLQQLRSFRHVDRFWATSPTTADALVEHGFARAAIEVIPLAVDRPAPARLIEKPTTPIRLLFVGRLTQAKGILDLIEALEAARARTSIPVALDVAGNEEYADPSCVAEAKLVVARRGLGAVVRFLGAVDDRKLDALYRGAHLLVIPSYHEGFCRPIVEGLRAGCVPVGYAAFNSPLVANGLGRMVPTGDRGALAGALVDLIEALARATSSRTRLLPLDSGELPLAEFDAAAQRHVQSFTFERVAEQAVQSVRLLCAR
jgi:glycosyltransferase involved in cell wall biosynthesis